MIITVDGVQYAPIEEGMRYSIVRCRNAGVHAGKVRYNDNGNLTLFESRRLWRWWGKTLSGLATEGTFAPDKCKFADEVPELTIAAGDWCEVIPCTDVAECSLRGVAPWKNE